MNAVIYSRVSTEGQDNSRQIAELTDYANYRKFNVLKVFQEKITGTSIAADRLEFKKLLEFIEKNKVDNLLVWELSRLGRKMVDVVNTVEDFSKKGINIFIKKEGFNTLDEKGKKSIMTSMIISVLSGFAEMEKETFSQRSKSGIRRNVATGGSGTGIIKAYGFKKVDKKLVVDEKEAEVVRMIYDKYLSGLGTLKIANYLNDLKVPTRYNKLFANRTMKQKHNFEKNGNDYTWKDGTIYSILTNSIYKGERKHKGEIFKIEPIVEPYIFGQVQKHLIKNPNKGTPETVNENVLKDILICGKCGRSYYICKRKNNKDNAYKCLSKRYNENCGNHSINIDKLNDAIFKICQPIIFNDVIERKPEAKKLLENRKTNIQIELTSLGNEIEKIEFSLTNADKQFLRGIVKETVYKDFKEETESHLEKLLAKRERLSEDLAKIKKIESRSEDKANLYNYDVFREYIKQAIEYVKVYSVKTDTSIYCKVKNDVCVMIEVKSNLDWIDDTPVYYHFTLSRYTNLISFPSFKKNEGFEEQIKKGQFMLRDSFSIESNKFVHLKGMKNDYLKKRKYIEV